MLKVLFLIHDLGHGGAEKVLVNLVNHLDRSKFDITVLALFGGGVNELAERLDEFDGVVLGSPVYYAGASGQLTAFLNRLFFCAGRHLAGKPGAAVVSCRRGGAASAFDQLNKYFTISGMPVASSQYWNSVHGMAPGEAAQDAEGMQVMRTLARNMSFLMKSIALGREKYGLPEKEPRVSTNFIR